MSPSALRIRLLGEFNLFNGEEEVTAVNTPRLQSLLTYLILHRDVPQSRQHLAFLLWPDSSDSQARANLRNLIYQLRRALPRASEVLHTTAETIYWRSNHRFSTDVAEFEKALGAGLLKQAVELYHGDLLPGCYEDWIIPERDRLQQIYLGVLEQLIQQLEDGQNSRAALDYAHRLLRCDPLHEATYRHLMRLYALNEDRIGVVRTYETCAAVLKKELNVEPGIETRQVYKRSLRMASTTRQVTENVPPTQAIPHPNNLPAQLTRFIGRKHEKIKVKHLVEANRLVTLSGAGGVGKTRLALAVASEVLDEFADGVWHVDLAPLSDPALVVQTVASSLGLREERAQPLLAQLGKFLHKKILLVILDNCEHLVETVRPMIETLLGAAPHLHILTTSRVVLGVSGETNWRVPSLAVPDMSRWAETGRAGDEPSAQSLFSLRQCESVQVFADRAVNALPTFALTKQNALAVGQICQQLGGIPLALELAAARVKVLTAQQISGYLKDAFWLLAQGGPSVLPRHQTMRATMDWSYSLLTPLEEVLFCRLAVFAGGATLEAVEAICSGEDIAEEGVLNLLSGLVDQSLVSMESSTEAARFSLHEIARQYALLRLEEAGGQAKLRNRHLRYFCGLAETFEPDLSGTMPPDAGARLTNERYNLRAALSWSLDPQGDTLTGLKLASALPGFWELQGLLSEERGWLEMLLARAGTVAEPGARAKALGAAGQMAYFQCDFNAARLFFEQSLALDRELGNLLRAADTLSRLGLTISVQQPYDKADPYFQESLKIYRELDNPSGLLCTLSVLGYNALRQGKLESSRVYLEESLALCRVPHDNYQEARIRYFMGHLARLEGDPDQARSQYRRSVTLLSELKNSWGLFYSLEAFGYLAVAEGRYERAARLFGYVQHLGEQIGTTYVPSESGERQQFETAAHAALDEVVFAEEWAKGRAMTMDEAVAFALE